VPVEPTICKSGAPTQDGSKYSSMRTSNSSIGRAAKSLMSLVLRMKRDKKSECSVTTEVNTNNGK
jgi:hypothetical protein